MTLIQISPQIPVLALHNGAMKPGRAFAWLDYGEDDHVLWGVFLDETGEPWWVPNHQIRARGNPSMGRHLRPEHPGIALAATVSGKTDRLREALAVPKDQGP